MKHRFAALVVLVVLMSSLVGGLMGGSAAAGADSSSQVTADVFLRDFTEALDVIQKNYVENIGPDKLVYSAIKGMLRSLDPHSSFFEPKEYSRLREEQHSKYSGLGIRVRPLLRERGRVVIVEPPAIGSPAERRGLRAGDVITRIEGESIDDWTSEEVVSHLRGPRGTTVNITVERPGGSTTRCRIQGGAGRDSLITVPYAFEVKPGIGYIKLDRFLGVYVGELKTKLKKLDPHNLSGLILDLRDNPGGLLNSGDRSSRHVSWGSGEKIVSTKGAPGRVRAQAYNAQRRKAPASRSWF